MRVIAGEFRSRVLKSVPGLDTRPTPDRLRESLFNVLSTRIEGSTFVDAFAGTGAVGIEALSRGAQHVIFIEESGAALRVLQANIESLGLQRRSQIARGKAASLIRQQKADILFLDPPYEQTKQYELCLHAAGHFGLVVAQHATKFALLDSYGTLKRSRVLKQGDNSLSFYSPSENG